MDAMKKAPAAAPAEAPSSERATKARHRVEKAAAAPPDEVLARRIGPACRCDTCLVLTASTALESMVVRKPRENLVQLCDTIADNLDVMVASLDSDGADAASQASPGFTYDGVSVDSDADQFEPMVEPFKKFAIHATIVTWMRNAFAHNEDVCHFADLTLEKLEEYTVEPGRSDAKYKNVFLEAFPGAPPTNAARLLERALTALCECIPKLSVRIFMSDNLLFDGTWREEQFEALLRIVRDRV